MTSTAFRCFTERCVRRQDGRPRLVCSVQCAWISLRSLFLMPWTICGIDMNTRRRDFTLTSGWAKADKIIFTWSVSSLSGASGSEEDSPDWAEIGVTFSLPVARGVEWMYDGGRNLKSLHQHTWWQVRLWYWCWQRAQFRVRNQRFEGTWIS